MNQEEKRYRVMCPVPHVFWLELLEAAVLSELGQM
jgi:hypothetical protein